MSLNLHVSFEELSAYLDGELTATEMADIGHHLALCSTCRDDLAELRAMHALLRQLPQHESPRSFALDASMLASSSPPPSRVLRLLPVMRTLSVAATIAFLLVSVVTIFQLTTGGDKMASEATLFETGSAPGASESVTGDSAAGSGLIDRGDSAARNPAVPLDPGGIADDPDAQSQAGAADGGPAASSQVAEAGDGDESGLWLIASLGLGVLAMALGAAWWAMSRMARPRPQLLG